MATQPHDRSLKILKEFLQTAVPLWIIRFKGLPWEDLQEIMRESERVLEESGELAVFVTVKKGRTAKAFNAVARAIAALSFVPGGLDIFGFHFETKHEGPTMEGMTKRRRFERMPLVELLEELARLYPTLMLEDTTKPGDGPFPVKDVLDGIKFSLEQEDVSVDLRIFLESPHWFWAMESLGFVTIWAFPEGGGSLLAFKEHEGGLPIRRPPFVSGTHRSMER